jgi:DMSO/TMAO reductase YedYZ molybdopterin-dependent catalytic subunit
MHVSLVFLVHRENNVVHMVFGDVDTARYAQALVIMIATIVAVVIFWISLSYWTLSDRPRAHRFLVYFTEIGRQIFLNWMRPRSSEQTTYTDKHISGFHWTNGLPPTEEESPEWITARDNNWEGYTVTLGDDLSGTSKVLTLDDIRELPQTSYIATHTCMQGWSATSRWEGVRLSDLLALLGPKPEGANYVMVESYGLAQKMIDNRPREPFYSVFDLETAAENDTILAIARNGKPLDLHLGAPARMRVESNHGYKMVKWVRSIRWIADYADHGDGRGGTREDSALQALNGRI